MAPYIENNGSNKASIVDKLAYSTHENREKTERTNKKLTHSHSNSNFAGGSASTTGSNFKKFWYPILTEDIWVLFFCFEFYNYSNNKQLDINSNHQDIANLKCY